MNRYIDGKKSNCISSCVYVSPYSVQPETTEKPNILFQAFCSVFIYFSIKQDKAVKLERLNNY